MKNIETKSGLWYDFKEGRLWRFAGIFLPVALIFYLDNTYSLSPNQGQLLWGAYFLFHGLWTYLSGTFPVFAKTGVTLSTIIANQGAARVITWILLIIGLIFIVLGFK